MSFNVSPKATSEVANSQNQAPSPRERAIAAMTKAAAPTAPLQAEAPAEVLQAQAAANVSDPAVEGQPDNVEGSEQAPKEETKAKEEAPLSTQYAILARKEKALRAKVQSQEAAYKAKEAALLEREAALKAKESEYQTGYVSKNRLKESPWEVLNEEGLDYDQLTQLALNTPQQDPATKAALARLEAQIKAQEEATANARKAYEDQQKQAYTQAVNQIRNEAKSLVSSSEEFETIKETGSVNDVVDLIERHFKETGEVLSTQDACREVEEYLVEEAMKIAKIKKIQQRLAPKPSTEKQPESPTKQQQPMKTLTNAIGQSKKLSVRERAIAAFKGEKIS